MVYITVSMSSSTFNSRPNVVFATVFRQFLRRHIQTPSSDTGQIFSTLPQLDPVQQRVPGRQRHLVTWVARSTSTACRYSQHSGLYL